MRTLNNPRRQAQSEEGRDPLFATPEWKVYVLAEREMAQTVRHCEKMLLDAIGTSSQEFYCATVLPIYRRLPKPTGFVGPEEIGRAYGYQDWRHYVDV